MKWTLLILLIFLSGIASAECKSFVVNGEYTQVCDFGQNTHRGRRYASEYNQEQDLRELEIEQKRIQIEQMRLENEYRRQQLNTAKNTNFSSNKQIAPKFNHARSLGKEFYSIPHPAPKGCMWMKHYSTKKYNLEC